MLLAVSLLSPVQLLLAACSSMPFQSTALSDRIRIKLKTIFRYYSPYFPLPMPMESMVLEVITIHLRVHVEFDGKVDEFVCQMLICVHQNVHALRTVRTMK